MAYRKPNHTQTPNPLFDLHLPEMGMAELKVVLFACRKTFGWHKDKDKISLTQFMEGTGMSRQAVINGIRQAIGRKVLERFACDDGFEYGLVLVNEVDYPPKGEVVNEVDHPSQRSLLGVGNKVDLQHTVKQQTDVVVINALKKFNNADMVIFGTPLYHFTMTGIMKDFIDRILPRLEPWLIPHPRVAGLTGHPERFHKPEKVFLISPCGFPEFEHFESLVATFKQIARMENWKYLGEILRPYAEPLNNPLLQELFTSYYDLLRLAGKQLIREGRISDELQTELREDLFPGGKQALYEMAADHWTVEMDRFKVPEDMRHTVK